jgi:3-phenylpropionate/trans-cinnamate dioxygenase ferredoxin subunit
VDDFVKVASVTDIPPGGRIIVRLPEQDLPVAVFNVDGELYCMADECTHDGGPVAEGELDDHVIECPRHGARFDIRDGRALSLPAIVPVDTFEVKVEGEDVLVRQTPR